MSAQTESYGVDQGAAPGVIRRREWASHETMWKGVVQGADLGTDVTILFFSTDEVGAGPAWHVHDYDEVFVVRSGRALFKIGDREVEASAGDVLFGPARIPHKFRNLGPGLFETTDIHLSARWKQTNLPDPDEEGSGA